MRRTRVGGLTLTSRSCERAGPGRPHIVLVHGLIVSGRYLMPTAERLAERFNVHVPDLPGYGGSDHPRETYGVGALADSLIAWMDAVGLRRPVLLGNSFGCQILAEVGARYPGRVDRLVLVGPTVDRRARSGLVQAIRWVRSAVFEKPSFLPILIADLVEIGPRRGWQTARHMLRDRIEEKLPRVIAPTLVVRGTRDAIVPQRWVEEVVRLLPRGELAIVPGSAHAVNHRDPIVLARLTEMFVEATPQGSLPDENRGRSPLGVGPGPLARPPEPSDHTAKQ